MKESETECEIRIREMAVVIGRLEEEAESLKKRLGDKIYRELNPHAKIDSKEILNTFMEDDEYEIVEEFMQFLDEEMPTYDILGLPVCGSDLLQHDPVSLLIIYNRWVKNQVEEK